MMNTEQSAIIGKSRLSAGKKIFFSLLVAFVGLLIVLTALEVFYRITAAPQKEKLKEVFKRVNQRPLMIDPKLGMIFKPYVETTLSNGTEYSVTQRSNRYGFLDRDRDWTQKDANTYRILLLGDSYVEACQVEIKNKVHVLLEEKLNASLSGKKKIETVALGFSGMGTCNELAFYENLGRQFKADLVVLLFILNDYANNSPALQAINEGWHPLKAPRYFLELDHTKNTVVQLPIQTDYQKYGIPVKIPPPVPEPEGIQFLDSWLSSSKAYGHYRGSIRHAMLGGEEQARVDDVFTQRIKFLQKDSFFGPKLKDWNYPDDFDMNIMFYSDTMPQVFTEALQLTDVALQILQQSCKRDGASLLVCAGHFLTTSKTSRVYANRTFTPSKALQRLKETTAKRQIPLLDLYEVFTSRGDIQDVTWKEDGHWNLNGHAWAAEGLAEFLSTQKWFQDKIEPSAKK